MFYRLTSKNYTTAAVQRYDSCVRQVLVKPLSKKIKVSVTDPVGNSILNGFLSNAFQ